MFDNAPATLMLMIPNIHKAKNINNTPRNKLIQGLVAIKFPMLAFLDKADTSLTPQDKNPTNNPIKIKVPEIPKP